MSKNPYKIRSSLVKDIKYSEYKSIYSLNLRTKGFGRSHLRDAYHYNHKHSLVITLWNGKKLLGWALLIQCLKNDKFVEYSINMYVRHSMRRHSIGTRLWEEIRHHLKEKDRYGHVCIWSKSSDGFFRSVRSKRIKVKVSPNYKKV